MEIMLQLWPMHVQRVLKNRPKCFFCNIFDKAPVILIKFGTKFPE